jgi:hypothetical protein
MTRQKDIIEKKQGLSSQHFTFFINYEWAQKAREFFPSKWNFPTYFDANWEPIKPIFA